MKHKILNSLTGLYFIKGQHFTGSFAQASELDGGELAFVRASYDASHLVNVPVVEVAPSTPRKEFKVAAISSKANSFGLHGIILVARDGMAFEVARCQCSPPSNAWKVGQLIVVSCTPGFNQAFEWAKLGVELPRVLATAPAKVVKQVWAK